MKLRVLALLLALCAPVLGQFTAQIQNGGTPIYTTKKWLVINCSTNLTCTLTNGVIIVTASSSASTNFSALTASTNSNAGTFAASGNTWDFSAATALKLKTGAGYAPTTDGLIGFNTTTHLPVFGSNGSTFTLAQSNAGASNNFLTTYDATTGLFTKAQPSFANLSGTATAGQLPATAVNSVVNDTNVTGSISAQALTLGWTGTLAAARLNSSVVQAITNDTNVTGSITAQNLTLGWTGTLAKARIIGTAVFNDQTNTFSTGTQDFSAVGVFRPKAGLTASLPGTCTSSSTVMDVYIATDATAGKNWYFCTATNTWTQESASGITGTGTANQIAKFTGTSTQIGDPTLSDDGTTLLYTGTSFSVPGISATGGTYPNLDLTEMAAGTCATAGHDYLHADSTAHRVKACNNGTGAFTTLAQFTDNLSVFAATTSAQFAGVISDEVTVGATPKVVLADGIQGTDTKLLSVGTWSGTSLACGDGNGGITNSGCATGSVTLNGITAANGAGSINNGDNAQVWNFALTTSGKSAFTFGENVAGTSAGTPYLVNIQTLAASTVNPLVVTAVGTANGIQVLKSGFLTSKGTGGIDSNMLHCDVTDGTKCVKFVLSGITTATTRNWTFPDSADTFAGIGAAQALTNKSYNGLTLTSTTGTFTLTNAKTLAVTNTLTFSGTDGTVMTFPTTSATVARTDAANTFTGTQTFAGALIAGTDNSVAGTVQLANSAANAHTIWGSGATTSNSVLGPTVVIPNGHIVDVTTATTIATLHDSGLLTANVVLASSPGAGIGHFAGSTQTLTSSLIVNADITNATIDLTTKVTGATPVANGGTALTSGTSGGVLGYTASGTLASSAAGAAKQVMLWGGAGATPTAITFPDTQYSPAANCVNAVAGPAWSTGATPAALCRGGTNNKTGELSPWGASDVAYIQFHIATDADLTTTLPNLLLELTSTSATNGQTIIMQESVACAKEDGSTTDDVAFNAARSFATITLNGNANRVWDTTITLNSTDLTGCAAPGIMWVKISRTTDTATNVGAMGLSLTQYRLLTAQAN